MSDDDIFRKKERIRKPRVHITYDVETEGGKVRKDLPFVVGVLGDFSGDPTEKLKPLEKREFIQVDRDNFDEVLARMKPGLNLRVKNTLEGGDKEFGVQLKFEKMEDFEPGQVVLQIDPLRKLMQVRNQIKELQSRMENSAELEEKLEEILKNTEQVGKLAKELGLDSVKPQEPSDTP